MASLCVAGWVGVPEVSTSADVEMGLLMALSEADEQSLQLLLGGVADAVPDWNSCAKGPLRKACICAVVIDDTPALVWVMPKALEKALSTACLLAEEGLAK